MMDDFSENLQMPILETLHASAQKHARHSNGLLIALEPNLGIYPHQSLRSAIVKGEAAEIDKITPITTLIRPNYGIVSAFVKEKEDDDTTASIDLIGTVLDSMHNSVLAFDHGEEVVTFIMNSLVVTNELRSRGHKFRSAIIASKMLDFLAIDLSSFGSYRKKAEEMIINAGITVEKSGLVFARNILSRGYEIQYLTIPNTQSTEELRRLQGTMIEQYNGHIKRTVKADLSPRLKKKPPILLNVATSGSINKFLDTREYTKLYRASGMYDIVQTNDSQRIDSDDVEVVGWIAPGITTFMGNAITFAAVAKMNVPEPFLRIDPKPIVLNDMPSVRKLGKKQVNLLDSVEPKIVHIYDTKGNLPLLDSIGNDLD